MDITQNIRALLYEKPLYRFIADGERDMNVLVIGWNSIVEAFVDQCLQAGQMKGHELNLCVCSADAKEATSIYLAKRPQLAEFVNVNGSLENSGKESYADLSFLTFDKEKIEDFFVEILAEAPQEKFHYAFVTLEDDEASRKMAERLAALMPGKNNVIFYAVCEPGERASGEDDSNSAVPVNFFDGSRGGSEELERMAFNTYLSWEKESIGDLGEAKEEFRKNQYHYDSSVSFALSIPYKLAGFGIQETDLKTAAGRFHELLEKLGEDGDIQEMAALEHRRWVLEKVLAGWRTPDFSTLESRKIFYDSCISRCSVKDEENRLHPSIVRCRSSQRLKDSEYGEKRGLWNTPSPLDETLDELDFMSVTLHRRMYAKARALRAVGVYGLEPVQKIGGILKENAVPEGLFREWERYLFCIKNLFDENLAYTKRHQWYRDCLVREVRKSSPVLYESVAAELEKLERVLFPVIESNLYRDYKENNEALIRKIPFILTFRNGRTLALAFQLAGSRSTVNDVIFRNVASASVLRPSRLLYFLYLDEESRLEIVNRMIRAASEFLAGRKFHCQIDFSVIESSKFSEEQRRRVQKCFERLRKECVIHEFEIQTADTYEAVCQMGIETFRREQIDLFDGSTTPFASMLANGKFVGAVHEQFPYFEFDSAHKRFYHLSGCEELRYITDTSYIGIEEMFGLIGAENMEFHYPALGDDYRKLWDIYTGKKRNGVAWQQKMLYSIKCWNLLCNELEDYHERHPETSVVEAEEVREHYHGKTPWKELYRILEELAGRNGGKEYLLTEPKTQPITRFSYGNADIKSVLTKAGEILEIYSYYEICRTGYFDEVACGYSFCWEEPEIINELDLVLTKGFQSIFVECKARTKLDQNFYFKLSSLVDMFGIGAKKVLLTTADTGYGVNNMQSERGELMDVITISSIQDILRIADKMRELL